MKKFYLIPLLLIVTFMTSGAMITYRLFDASQITSGTLDAARLPTATPGMTIQAEQITGGTVSNDRLPATINVTTEIQMSGNKVALEKDINRTTVETVLVGSGVSMSNMNSWRFSSESMTGIVTKKPVLFALPFSTALTFSDMSGYGNTFTAVGSPASAAHLGGGFSLTMSGSTQYFTAPDRDEFSFGDGAGNDLPFSVSVVANIYSEATTRCFISKNNAAAGLDQFEWKFYLTAEDKAAVALIQKAGSNVYTNTMDTGLSAGYAHLCFTYDGTRASPVVVIYANGIAVASTVGGGGYAGMSNTAAGLVIGADRGAAGVYESNFNSSIANASIFASCLTSSEVLLDYYRARALWGI